MPLRRPRSFTRVAAALAGAGVALAGLLASPTATPTAAAAEAPRYGCTGYGSLLADNPLPQVLRDEFAWGRYAPVGIGDGAGDIDWRADPHRQVSWRMRLHSLRWLGSAIRAGAAGDDAALDHARAITRDWLADHATTWRDVPAAAESTMHRTNVLICLRQAAAARNGGELPGADAWIDEALLRHAADLREHFSGYGNHGTDESIAVLGVGCVLGRPDLSGLGATRLGDIVTRVIDDQGATNEQSTGYAVVNYALWGRAAAVLESCAPESPARPVIAARRAALGEFIAHAGTPLGPLHQLGNTEQTRLPPFAGTAQSYAASGGLLGAAPADRVRVYRAGYVFGRSGWGGPGRPYATQSAYSLRFGARKMLHGHHDHTSITWQARGREILVDPGYGEYTKDAWEAYYKGPTAHNQLVVPGMTGAYGTRLVRSSIGAGGADTYRFADSPAPGVRRTRDVLITSAPEVALVVDRVSSARSVPMRQLWHLPAGTAVTVSASGRGAVGRAGASATSILQLPVGAPSVPRGSVTTVEGATSPIQGWVWSSIFQRRPAPVVGIARTGSAATIAAAVVAGPARGGARATARSDRLGTTWTITDGRGTLTVRLAPDGSLARVG